jgi:hypothetical protein
LRRALSILSYVSAILAGLLLLIVVISISPDLLRFSLGPLTRGEYIIDYETVLIWRERVLDTIFQTIAMVAALLGVLALLLRGGGDG